MPDFVLIDISQKQYHILNTQFHCRVDQNYT
jgi:hypothetical protein